MRSVSEAIIRDWLEGLGFLVAQTCKYQVMARAKRPDETWDFLALNPTVLKGGPPPPGVWAGATMRKVRAAVIGVRGWFTERFAPSAFADAPELLRLGAREVRQEAARRLGVEDVVAVICLPALPASAELREQTLTLLRQHGIAGVVLFSTVLLELSANIRKQLDYDRSEVLQMLRILCALDLLRDAQPDLFRHRRRLRKLRAGSGSGTSGSAPAAE